MVSEWSRVREGINIKKSDFQRCAMGRFVDPPPPPQLSQGSWKETIRRMQPTEGEKNEFYRSSQPDLLPAAVNQRSCVIVKHTSTACLRSLTQPALRSHPKTPGRKSMLVQICAQILMKAPVFPSVGFIFSPADVSFPDVLSEDQ